MNNDRLGVLDGLRGLAILLVVWYHLELVSGYAPPRAGFAEMFARSGFLGVDLFFFVSGFCICYPYARAREQGRPRPPLAGFIRKRAAKIVPSYVLALAVFGVLYRGRFENAGVEFAHLLAHLGFVHVWFHDSFGSFSGPLWTLGVEVQFYALFALLVPQIERRPLAVYVAFLAIAVAYRAAIGAFGLERDFVWLNQLPAVLDVFGAGLLAAVAGVALQEREVVPSRAAATTCALVAAALVAAGFAAAGAAGQSGGDDAVHHWLDLWRVAFGPVLMLATLGIVHGPPVLRAALAGPPLARLSGLSYNAYLWNLEIAVGLQAAGLAPWAVFWAGAAGTLAVAALATYGFERPLQRAGLALRAPGWRVATFDIKARAS